VPPQLDGARPAAWEPRPLAPSVPSRGLAARAARTGHVEVVVGARSPRALRAVEAAAGRAAVVGRVARVDAVALRLDARGLRAVARLPGVRYVEPRGVRRLLALDAYDRVDPATGRSFMWGFHAVHGGQALAALRGGTSVPVAVLDTGVDLGAPDLAQNVRSTFDAADAGIDDTIGHGTFVAGVIAAVPGNGIGVAGVAGNTPLLVVRVADGEGAIADDTAARAIIWAADRGARVINLSFGGAGDSRVLDDALDYAFARGVVLVAAAGNDGLSGDAVDYPAAHLGGLHGAVGTGLSVAASRPDGTIAPWSSSNAHVSVAAPGAAQRDVCSAARPALDGVFSLIPRGIASDWDGVPAGFCPERAVGSPGASERYAYGEGTSFAAPVVAGVAADVLARRPGLTARQVIAIIARTTQGAGHWNARAGHGVVDAAAALAAASTFDTAPPALDLRATAGQLAIGVRARARDRARAGERTASAVRYLVQAARGRGPFRTVGTWSARPVATAVASAAGQLVRVRVIACDANGNCASRVSRALRARRAHLALRVTVGRRAGRTALRLTLRPARALALRARAIVDVASGAGFSRVGVVALRLGAARTLLVDASSGARFRVAIAGTRNWYPVRVSVRG
jgi:subtilisin family serine protease